MTEENEKKTASRFDPRPYLIKLKGKDYLPTAARILWLRTEYPDAVITSRLEQLDLDRGFALFYTSVSIPGRGSADGWGSETAKDFPDFIEKGSTKSIGRALAALGFGTQFCYDFDFEQDGGMGDIRKVVDSPVEPRQKPVSAAKPTPPAKPASPAKSAESAENDKSAEPTENEEDLPLPANWIVGLQKLAPRLGWDQEAFAKEIRARYKPAVESDANLATLLKALIVKQGRELRDRMEEMIRANETVKIAEQAGWDTATLLKVVREKYGPLANLPTLTAEQHQELHAILKKVIGDNKGSSPTGPQTASSILKEAKPL